MHGWGTPQRPSAATISNMSGNWRARWNAAQRRIAATPYAPALTAVVLAVIAIAEASTQAASISGTGQANGGFDTGNAQLDLVLLSLIATLPLALVRSYPVAVAVSIAAANAFSLGLLHVMTVASVIAQLIVGYVLGRAGRQLLAAVLYLPFLLLVLIPPAPVAQFLARPLGIVLASLGPLTAWAGAADRARHEAREYTESRADIADTLLEHTARGERARISRELHDVVAHHLSMIAVQAETARLTTPGMPAAGAERLSSIGDTARAALTSMRGLLGVLREDTSEDRVDRQPQPGLYQLNELIDQAREVSDASTRLIISGWPEVLDPTVELAAYRIVQEALTNARRHAAGAAVDVELHFGPDELWLRVRDNGPGPPDGSPDDSPSGGNGLLGMRERAAAVGGTLHTGAATSGGFLVEARLPAKAEKAAAR
jgi:signal transduction histidine kinase